VNTEEGASGNEDNQFNEDRALMRHEFMDGIIRIAIMKYIGAFRDPWRAIEELCNQNVGIG